jgi:hypothetical protein
VGISVTYIKCTPVQQLQVKYRFDERIEFQQRLALDFRGWILAFGTSRQQLGVHAVVYVCVYVCIYVHVHVHDSCLRNKPPTAGCSCRGVYMYVCIYVCTCTCIHTYILAFRTSRQQLGVHAVVYICVYVCMYMYMYMHTYIHSCLQNKPPTAGCSCRGVYMYVCIACIHTYG